MEYGYETADRSSVEQWVSCRLTSLLVTLMVSGLLFGAVTLVFYRHHFSGPISSSHGAWAEFGDFFGGTLSPVFSFLSFLALLFTLIIQNREFKSSAKALRDQIASVQVQNFERTFFELLTLYTDSVRAIDLRDRQGNVTTQGRDCFRIFRERLQEPYSKELYDQKKLGNLGVVQAAYESFFKSVQHEIGHCFRTLYHVFKFIDESNTPDSKRYASIMRAQLSTYELTLLFYNGLHPVGKKFKPLIEKYALLENSELNFLFNPPDHIPLYDLKAYGDQDLSRYIKNG